MLLLEQEIELQLIARSESAGDQLVFLLPAIGDNNHVAMPQDVEEDQSEPDTNKDFESIHRFSVDMKLRFVSVGSALCGRHCELEIYFCVERAFEGIPPGNCLD